MLPLELAGDPTARQKAREALASVGSMRARRHYPKQLSGGEKQRVAIARAFVTKPDILFADEPTGNLDTASGDRVANLLFDMNRQSGTTLVLVTHDRQLADRCDRVLELEAGGCCDEQLVFRSQITVAGSARRRVVGFADGNCRSRRRDDGGRLFYRSRRSRDSSCRRVPCWPPTSSSVLRHRSNRRSSRTLEDARRRPCGRAESMSFLTMVLPATRPTRAMR